MYLSKARNIAPKDATHYSFVDSSWICFYYIEDGVALYMSVNGDQWFDCSDTDFSNDIADGEIIKLW